VNLLKENQKHNQNDTDDFRYRINRLVAKYIPNSWGIVRNVIIGEIKRASSESLESLRKELHELIK
jgi:hypothetical protein